MKRGILLVSFGAGNSRSAATLKNVRARMEARFGLPVRWAFTSEVLRARLAYDRTKSDSVLKALRRMYFERYTHVAVQSLHLIPGLEYSGVLADAEQATAENGLVLKIGKPLLTDSGDVQSAARTLLKHLPAGREPGEAVVCMGHGSPHSAESLYLEWAGAVRRLDPLVYVACMKGSLVLEDVLPPLREQTPSRVWLLPLLSVIGKHSLDDMAGGKPDSWKSRLERQGFVCRADLRALADGPDFVDLWAKRIRESLDALTP